MRIIHGEKVFGAVVDDETRCAHYHSPLDVVAIRFKCCDRWYPCRECHDEIESHDARTWQQDEFGSKAILCGACGHQLTIGEYFVCENKCPSCLSGFNPGCAKHYHLYFDRKRAD